MIPDWFVFLHFIYVRVHFFARVPVFFVRFFAYQLLPASKCTNLTTVMMLMGLVADFCLFIYAFAYLFVILIYVF